MVIYSGSESRWFAGTVEDNSTFLAKTGGTMTGDIVFAGSQTFPSSLTSGLLSKSGGTMTGKLITDEVEVPLGKTITIKRGNNNTSIGGLDIKGYQPGQFTVETDIFAVTYGNGTSTGDSINYKGRTDGSGNIQTKSSVQALINANPATGFVPLSGGVMTGDLQIDISSTNPSNIALEIEEDGNTNFRVLRSGTVSSKVITCTGMTVNGPTATDGDVTVTGNIAASGTLSAAGNVTFSNPTEIIGVNTNGSDDVLRQDGRITFTGACDDAFIGKTGGTNNFVKIGAGSGAGKIIATMGLLENGKRSFTSSVGSSDFIGTSTVWNKTVAQSYNVVSGTAATYNGDGSLASATIAAPITFTGNNVHNGTITQNGAVTHNADFTVNSNHAVYFKSAVFQSNGDYNFNGTSSSNLTQKIRNKGQASKVLMITATDTGNGEQNILSLAYAGSQFYRPISVPTPTANAHAATKQYVDQNSSTIQTGTNSNPSLSSGEMYWNTSLKVLYVGN